MIVAQRKASKHKETSSAQIKSCGVSRMESKSGRNISDKHFELL